MRHWSGPVRTATGRLGGKGNDCSSEARGSRCAVRSRILHLCLYYHVLCQHPCNSGDLAVSFHAMQNLSFILYIKVLGRPLYQPRQTKFCHSSRRPQVPVAYNWGLFLAHPCVLCRSADGSASRRHWPRPRTKEKRVRQSRPQLLNLPPGSNTHPPCFFSRATAKLQPGGKFKATTCTEENRVGMLLNRLNEFQSMLVSVHTFGRWLGQELLMGLVALYKGP